MRFKQLMKNSNAILRKKLYKSGKNWIVKSTLSLASGLALFGVSQSSVVKADVDSNQVAISQATAQSNQVNQSTDNNSSDNQMKVNSDAVTNSANTGTAELKTKQTNPQTENGEQVANATGYSNKSDQVKALNSTIMPQNKVNLSQRSTSIDPNTPQQPATNEDSGQNSENVATENQDASGKIGSVQWNYKSSNNTLLLEPGDLGNLPAEPWGQYTDLLKENVQRVDFDGYITDNLYNINAGKNVSGLFKDFKNLNELDDLGYFIVKNTDDLSNLFSGCTNLSKIDLTNLDMNKNQNTTDMFKGDVNLKSIVTYGGEYGDGSSRLATTGLNIENDNQSLDVPAWSSNNSDIPDLKSTNYLTSYYDGNKKENLAITWTYNSPVKISVIAEDTNGKDLGTATIYLPTGSATDPVIKDYMTSAQKNFVTEIAKLKENGAVVLNDSNSETGSRMYTYAADGNDDITRGIKDSQGNQCVPLNKENTKDPYETVMDEVNKYLAGVTGADSGKEAEFYLVYPAKKNPNSETHNNSSSSGGSTVTREIEGIEENIATYAQRPDVALYDDNGSIITDQKLAPNSDWFTDESMQLDKDKYYRVATNQWVKANDVYLYYNHAINIQVNNGTIANLVTSSGKTVTDRALQANSGWYTDRYTYINNEKYYRVATNEFVSANDVKEY